MAKPLSINNSGTSYSLFSVQIGVLLRPYRNASPMPSRLGEMWHRIVHDVTMKSRCFSLQFFVHLDLLNFVLNINTINILINYDHTSSHNLA